MSEWISVEERLPPETGDYLTWSRHSYWKNQVHVWLDKEQAWEQEWLRKKRTELKPKTWITHWMPLPEPPKC